MRLTPLDLADVNTFLNHFPKWRHLTKSLNCFCDFLDQEIDFFFSSKSSIPFLTN